MLYAQALISLNAATSVLNLSITAVGLALVIQRLGAVERRLISRSKQLEDIGRKIRLRVDWLLARLGGFRDGMCLEIFNQLKTWCARFPSPGLRGVRRAADGPSALFHDQYAFRSDRFGNRNA